MLFQCLFISFHLLAYFQMQSRARDLLHDMASFQNEPFCFLPFFAHEAGVEPALPKRQKAWQDLKDLQKCPSEFGMLFQLRLEMSIFHQSSHALNLGTLSARLMYASKLMLMSAETSRLQSELRKDEMPFAVCYHMSIRVICRFSDAFLELI